MVEINMNRIKYLFLTEANSTTPCMVFSKETLKSATLKWKIDGDTEKPDSYFLYLGDNVRKPIGNSANEYSLSQLSELPVSDFPIMLEACWSDQTTCFLNISVSISDPDLTVSSLVINK